MRRAFDREGLAGRIVPFAATVVAALGVGLFDLRASDRIWLTAGALLSGATVVFCLVISRWRLPPWTDVIPPLVYIGAVAALRHGAGGAISGYSPLYLVPGMWLALFGTQRQLLICVGAMIVALGLPIVLVGGADYPHAEWRRLLILTIVGGMSGMIIQQLVREARALTTRAVDRGRELAEQRDVTEAILNAASDAVVSFDWSGSVVNANATAAVLFGRDDLVGRDVFDALVPDHEAQRLRDGFGRLLVGDGPVGRDSRFEADLLRADGSLVPVEMAVARSDGPAGVRIHAFVRDTTIRRAAEQSAREHRDDLGRLLAVARELDRAGTDGRAAICAAARELGGADFVLFFTREPVSEHLVVTGSAGDTTMSTEIALDPGHSMAAQVLRTAVPVFSGDLAADPRLDPAVVERVGAASAYWQPVTRDDKAIGVLVAYWRRPIVALPERVAVLLGLFATQAATIIERSDLLARVEALARTDALTGTANRRALDETLTVALADARRTGRPLAVAMLDLDHFKRHNDRYGHQAGDELLRATAAAWMGELRPGDTLARYGGEEFLAVLRSCDAAGSVVVADRLREVMPGLVTASAGTAAWDGEETLASLVARADAALYAAKDAGRDRTIMSQGPRASGPDPTP